MFRAVGMGLMVAACMAQVCSVVIAQSAPEVPVILAVGESTTAGFGVPDPESYPAQLQAILTQRGYAYRVVNHGRSGSTTDMALRRLDRGLRLLPRIVIIALGGNDGGNRVPEDRTRENLRKMISLYRLVGAEVFLADRGPADRRSPSGGESLFARLGAEEGAILMPSLLEGVSGRPELLLSDGSHPNGKGYAVVSQRIFEIVEPYLDPPDPVDRAQ
jgi:acyl-CoA thioesterase-1